MYERMLNKDSLPSESEIMDTIGERGRELLTKLEQELALRYALVRELRFPFGGSYGWGYKYSHKSAHLCYVFFETGAFTVTLQIGDKQSVAVEEKAAGMLPKTQELWHNRYPCGETGGWVHYRVLNEPELRDVLVLIGIKKPAIHKQKERTE